MASKRKHASMVPEEEEPVDPSDELLFFCLGGGNEVGRSCHIIQYKGKTVMLDAGMHPAYDGLAGLPFYDEFDLSTIDVLLISHFHIDHAASLPYVLAKTNFRGRIFMTHATKAIYKWLIQDSVRVGNAASSSEQRVQIYTEADHLSTFPQIEAIDYHTTHTVSSIRITPYPAGHVLGAAMFLIEIAGLKVLFTGDYSRENDRHLVSAEIPQGIKIDVLITESTYGIASHVPRLERETQLMRSITGILNRGGRALLPVFALGRAQELLLILDEYWARHPEYQKIPIYYASNLARKCMVVYQTYIGAMNDNIKRMFRERITEAENAKGGGSGSGGGGSGGSRGPWDFTYIRSLKSLDRFDDVGGCVMLASPGMMQNGVSRELLERWAPDNRNGVVITGYSVEGTMAKQIMQEPESIHAIMTTRGGGASGPGRPRTGAGREGEQVMIPRRCSVQEFSFAAHVDGPENREFIERVNAPVVILVHGEKHNMTRLKSKLLSLNSTKPAHLKTKVFSPANCEELRIPIRSAKTAKVVGRLAEQLTCSPTDVSQQQQQQLSQPRHDALVNGAVLVQHDLRLSLMAPEDLHEYAGLTTTTITCRQKITLAAVGLDLIRWALEGAFGGVAEVPLHGREGYGNGDDDGDDSSPAVVKRSTTPDGTPPHDTPRARKLLVMDTVALTWRRGGEMEIEWEGNMTNDWMADAVLCLLLQIEGSPAAVKHSSKTHNHTHAQSNGVDFREYDDDNDDANAAATLRGHNPHAAQDAPERLSRLLLFLEAQFGADAITPIETPPPPPPRQPPAVNTLKAEPVDEGAASANADVGIDADAADDDADAAVTELARLHTLGIPVPGLLIRVERHDARVWLEDLRVECANAVVRDRVRAVVERAVECVSPIWAPTPLVAAPLGEGDRDPIKREEGQQSKAMDM